MKYSLVINLLLVAAIASLAVYFMTSSFLSAFLGFIFALIARAVDEKRDRYLMQKRLNEDKI